MLSVGGCDMRLLLRCLFWLLISVQLLLADFVLLVYSWVTVSFGRPNFWQSLLHMNQGPSSLSPVQWMLFAVCFAGFLVVVGLSVLLVRMLMRFLGKTEMRRLRHVIVLLLVSGGLAAVSLHVDRSWSISKELSLRFEPTTFLSDNFRLITCEDVVFPAEKTNLVVIVAESFEDTFTQEERVGANLLPRLTVIRDRGLSFRGQLPVFGLGCTRMAQCAMLYGIPTVSYSFVSNPFSEEFGRQFPCRIPSLLALLSAGGYSAAYVQGGSMDFVDTRGMFDDVPDLISFERKDFERKYGAEALKVSFGAQDELLFPECERILSVLASGDKPFVFMCKTVNTHNRCEYLPDDAPHPRGSAFENALLNSGELVAGFLDWLVRQPFADRTAVVVVGDHSYHGKIVDRNPSAPRQEFNLVILPHGERKIIERQFATYDWAPTFLELIGCRIPDGRMGLGVSLLNPNTRTILERFGFDRVDLEVRHYDKAYESLVYEGERLQ